MDAGDRQAGRQAGRQAVVSEATHGGQDHWQCWALQERGERFGLAVCVHEKTVGRMREGTDAIRLRVGVGK